MIDPRARLVQDCQRGPITLVLGAGCVFESGVPLWPELASLAYERVTGERAPWDRHDAELAEAKQLLAAHGYPAEMLRRLSLDKPASTPLGLQIVLERVHDAVAAGLGSTASRDLVNEKFAEHLRAIIYRGINHRNNTTFLALVAALRADYERGGGRIRRVITFNVDDLVETYLNDDGEPPVVWSISRASGHLRRAEGERPAPIPIYHCHGFLPRHPHREIEEARDWLVFTDAQYWRTVAEPHSFPNRVLANALHDSRCVFIGLSMTDVNLMRWLGVRFNEIVNDKEAQYLQTVGANLGDARRAQRRALERHYWIKRPSVDDLIEPHMAARGILPVHLDAWGAPFTALMQECFG